VSGSAIPEKNEPLLAVTIRAWKEITATQLFIDRPDNQTLQEPLPGKQLPGYIDIAIT
jgi:hypothetical protein